MILQGGRFKGMCYSVLPRKRAWWLTYEHDVLLSLQMSFGYFCDCCLLGGRIFHFSGIGCTSFFKQGFGHSVSWSLSLYPPWWCSTDKWVLLGLIQRAGDRLWTRQLSIRTHHRKFTTILLGHNSQHSWRCGRVLVGSSPSEILFRPICSSSSFTTGHFDWTSASDLSLGHMIIIIYDYHQTKTTTALNRNRDNIWNFRPQLTAKRSYGVI